MLPVFSFSLVEFLGGWGVGQGRLLFTGEVSASFLKNLPDAFQGGETTFTSIHSFRCPALASALAVSCSSFNHSGG